MSTDSAALKNALVFVAGVGALSAGDIHPQGLTFAARPQPPLGILARRHRIGRPSRTGELSAPSPCSPTGSIDFARPEEDAQAFDLVNEILPAEQKALARISELALETSVANWDGEAGQPIGARQWEDARSCVSRALRELRGIPAPFVSACGDGTAHLQWTTPRGNRGVIEIGREGYMWSFLAMSSEDGEDALVDLQSTDEAFGRIRALFG